MKVEIVEGTFEHVVGLLEDMREVELAQCERLYGGTLEKEAARIYSNSLLTFAGLVDDKCVVTWGVHTSLLAGEGWVWMLGSKFVEEHPIIFLRHSKRMLRELLGTFPRLYGIVLTEFDCSRQWLEWLGFEVGEDSGGIRPFRI